MPTKSAIVTGAAKRVGRSLAIGLAQRGYNIGLHYNNSTQEALEVKTVIEKLGRQCVLLQCDLLDKHATSQLMGVAAEKLKNIELLVNNASIFEKGDLLQTDIAKLDKHFAINMQAPFILTLYFAHLCKSGNIINIIDSSIVKTDTEYFAYQLSKKSLYDLTRLSAKSLAPNIRVNAIAPGSTMQPIDLEDEEIDYLQIRAQQVPLKMAGEAKYLMQGIDFLLANNFVTGQCLFIDGGAHIEY